MKNLIIILITAISLSSCITNDGATIPEIDKLPPATQTGANTFGCLLDGQAFLARGGTNPLDCV